MCYRQFDEVSQAFKARPVLTLVSVCHQQCYDFHVILGQSPVTGPFVLNLASHKRSTETLKKSVRAVMINLVTTGGGVSFHLTRQLMRDGTDFGF